MDKIPVKAISVAEARSRLSKLKPLITKMKQVHSELVELENKLNNVKTDGTTELVKARKYLILKEDELIDIQEHLWANDCIIKNPAIGLIDFISIRKGKPVWLCFQDGEDELIYYHKWKEGYVGRKVIDFH